MKRIYLLLFLVALSVSSFATHRSADLQVTLASPTTSTVVSWGGSFNVDAIVKNLGPDSVKYAGDSILWWMSLSGQNLSLDLLGTGTPGVYWLRYHAPLKTNDTLHIRVNGIGLVAGSQTADSNRTFCLYVLPRGPQTDSLVDPATSSNNTSCATFMFQKNGFPASVNNITPNGNEVNVYPNPASAVLNFNINLTNSASVNVEVLDLSGRVVLQSNQGMLNAGQHSIPVDTRNLQNGFYVYHVYTGNDMSAGKIMIDNR